MKPKQLLQAVYDLLATHRGEGHTEAAKAGVVQRGGVLLTATAKHAGTIDRELAEYRKEKVTGSPSYMRVPAARSMHDTSWFMGLRAPIVLDNSAVLELCRMAGLAILEAEAQAKQATAHAERHDQELHDIAKILWPLHLIDKREMCTHVHSEIKPAIRTLIEERNALRDRVRELEDGTALARQRAETARYREAYIWRDDELARLNAAKTIVLGEHKVRVCVTDNPKSLQRNQVLILDDCGESSCIGERHTWETGAAYDNYNPRVLARFVISHPDGAEVLIQQLDRVAGNVARLSDPDDDEPGVKLWERWCATAQRGHAHTVTGRVHYHRCKDCGRLRPCYGYVVDPDDPNDEPCDCSGWRHHVARCNRCLVAFADSVISDVCGNGGRLTDEQQKRFVERFRLDPLIIETPQITGVALHGDGSLGMAGRYGWPPEHRMQPCITVPVEDDDGEPLGVMPTTCVDCGNDAPKAFGECAGCDKPLCAECYTDGAMGVCESCSEAIDGETDGD